MFTFLPMAKRPPTSFSPVTSANIGISPKNFLTFSFNPFALPHIVELEPKPPLKKKWFFWSNPYKIEVVITSLIEMLQLPNFGHMNTSTI